MGHPGEGRASSQAPHEAMGGMQDARYAILCAHPRTIRGHHPAEAEHGNGAVSGSCRVSQGLRARDEKERGGVHSMEGVRMDRKTQSPNVRETTRVIGDPPYEPGGTWHLRQSPEEDLPS